MSKQHSAPIVGARFRPPAQSILNLLPVGAKLDLIPEPTNAYDPNAIAVHIKVADIPDNVKTKLVDRRALAADDLTLADSFHLGYLKAEYAKKLVESDFAGCAATLNFGAEGGAKATWRDLEPGPQ